MDQPLTERRVSSRFGQPTIAHIQAVLRPGRQVWLVNLSAGGALIEGRRPLRPGSRVYLQLSSNTRAEGRPAQVLRCFVASLAGEDGVRYHGALRFDDHWATVWEQFTHPGYRMPVVSEDGIPTAGQALPTRDRSISAGDEGGY